MSVPIVTKVGVLIEDKGRLLLIKEKKTAKSPYKFNIVKGTFDSADKNFETTAVRESLEEAGADIKIKRFFNAFVVKRARQTTIQLNFLASFKGHQLLLRNKKIKDEYISDSRFFDKVQIKQLQRKDFINKRAYESVQHWLQKTRYSRKATPN